VLVRGSFLAAKSTTPKSWVDLDDRRPAGWNLPTIERPEMDFAIELAPIDCCIKKAIV
jgi:hypothetical protein